MKNKNNKLTVKQQRFVDYYDGNAYEAAKKAGYAGNYNTISQMGKENLRKPTIIKALKEREKKRNGNGIADRQERQEFWSKILRGEMKVKKHIAIGRGEDREVIEVEAEPDLKDRLKASEHLGKSEADFIERIEATVNHDLGDKLGKALAQKGQHAVN